MHLQGIPRNDIKLTDESGDAVTRIRSSEGINIALEPESNQSEAVFIVTEDATAQTLPGNEPGCHFFNTLRGCDNQQPVRVELDIHFDEPRDSVGDAPFNPFLFRTGYRGLEVHLVDKPPTDLADPYLFGLEDDDSVYSFDRFYRTQNNLPWALDIPNDWEYPFEGADILSAYPNMAPWALNNGQSNPDWYIDGKLASRVYKFAIGG